MTLPFRTVFLLILFLSPLQGSAEESGEDQLSALTFAHSVEMEEAEKPFRENIEALNANYIAALQRESAKVQSSGNLEELLQFRKEIERVTEFGTPGTDPYPGADSLRTKYSEAVTAFTEQNWIEKAKVAVRHATELEELKIELTKDGDLATAMKVDQILKGLEISEPSPPSVRPASNGVFATNTVVDSPIFEGDAFHGELELERGVYKLNGQVMLGSDVPEKREDRFGNVVAPAGTVFQGGELFINNGSLRATQGLFQGVDLNVDLHGEFVGTDCIFDEGKLRKGGAWSVKYYSAKWTLDNCVLHKCFVDPFRPRANGVKITGCTIIGASLSAGEYYETPVEESEHEWRKVERCLFIDCEIPESFLLMTEDCVFDNCTFIEDIDDVNPEKSATVKLYFQDALPSPPRGNGRVTFEAEAASELRKEFGSTLKHEF